MSSVEPAMIAEDLPALQKVRNILNHYLFDISSTGGRITNYMIMLIIAVTVFLSMLDTVPAYHERLSPFLPLIETSILYFFLLEYLLRIFSAKKRMKYVKAFMASLISSPFYRFFLVCTARLSFVCCV